MTLPATHHQKSTTLVSNAPSTGEVTCLNQLWKIHLHILYQAAADPIEIPEYSKILIVNKQIQELYIFAQIKVPRRGCVSKTVIHKGEGYKGSNQKTFRKRTSFIIMLREFFIYFWLSVVVCCILACTLFCFFQKQNLSLSNHIHFGNKKFLIVNPNFYCYSVFKKALFTCISLIKPEIQI